jgi:hypothetical protein
MHKNRSFIDDDKDLQRFSCRRPGPSPAASEQLSGPRIVQDIWCLGLAWVLGRRDVERAAAGAAPGRLHAVSGLTMARKERNHAVVVKH